MARILRLYGVTMRHPELPNIPNFMDFGPGRRVLSLGLIVLLGQAAWVPSPNPASVDWSPPPLQESREAPLASR